MGLFPPSGFTSAGTSGQSILACCSLCQARIKSEGLKNEEELQSYFVRDIDKYLASKGPAANRMG